MNILCFIDSLCPGGAQRQLVELAIGFKEKGHVVSFLTYHDIPFYKHNLDDAGISVICLSEPNYLKRIINIRRFIRKGDFDVVLSFLEGPCFINEISGFPYHKWRIIAGERNANPKIIRSFRLIIYRWFHVLADSIVANSKANLQLVFKANPFIRNCKCKVIYNIIDFTKFKPGTGYSPRRNSKTHIVIAGRLSYQKNIMGLVDALIMLNAEQREKLLISWYGDDDHEENSEQVRDAFDKIQKHKLEKIIQFYPAIRNIQEKFQESDAVAIFSLFEGFPNAICEGMACGKPIVCSAVSDISDMLPVSGALLCDPCDPGSIMRSLCAILNAENDQLIEMGTLNAEFAAKNFNRENIINQYLELFQ